MHGPTLELALVDEPRPGLAQRGHGGGPRPLAREGRRRTRLVVVLDEANEPLLVGELRREVPDHLPCLVGRKTVIEPLVVAVVEALLLKRPLEVPVRLGHEHEPRMDAPTEGITSGQ